MNTTPAPNPQLGDLVGVQYPSGRIDVYVKQPGYPHVGTIDPALIERLRAELDEAETIVEHERWLSCAARDDSARSAIAAIKARSTGTPTGVPVSPDDIEEDRELILAAITALQERADDAATRLDSALAYIEQVHRSDNGRKYLMTEEVGRLVAYLTGGTYPDASELDEEAGQ